MASGDVNTALAIVGLGGAVIIGIMVLNGTLKVPGVDPSGILPGVSASPSSRPAAAKNRCWPIGNGSLACACAGKQWFQMGASRRCSDCEAHCRTGSVGTGGVVAPGQTGITPRKISENCSQAANGQYCWTSGGKSICMGRQLHYCKTILAFKIWKYSSNNSSNKTNYWACIRRPRFVDCRVTATGATGKRWVCMNMQTRQSVIQAPTWKCNGGDARALSVGATCTTIR